MKKFIISLIALTFTTNCGFAQTTPAVQSKLLNISESRWNIPESYALLDDKAEQVGTYTVRKMPEGNYHYIVDYNGKKIEIEAYTSIGIAPEVGRIITWGAELDVHFAYTLSYKIYDLSGDLIRSAVNVNYAPFRGTISKDGDFIYAARSIANDADTNLYLNKVNLNGQLEWTKNIGLRDCQEICVSGYSGDIALMERDWIAGKSEIKIYNREGIPIHTIDREVMSSMEFLGEGKLAISGSNLWFIYSYTNGTVDRVLQGRINGNVMSMHPFSIIERDYIAIAHPSSKKLMVGFRVDIYDLNSGNVVHSLLVSNDALARQAYRCLTYDEERKVLTVRAGKQEMTYQLIFSK